MHGTVEYFKGFKRPTHPAFRGVGCSRHRCNPARGVTTFIAHYSASNPARGVTTFIAITVAHM